MKKLILSFVLLSFIGAISAQEKILLYPNGAKESNELNVSESWRDSDFLLNISEARMYAYIVPKEKANGTAVVICPGGGYSGLSVIKEGKEFAEWFNERGVSAFVLYYRMPNGHYQIPLEDAQTALAIVHRNAKKWNIDEHKIGIMGFSAGGHLASTVGTHFKNAIERPAFMILGYPVVTMDNKYTHQGSRENLLGKNPSEELIKRFSNELQVTKKTPPTFIVHAKDDRTVPIINSENLFKALQSNHVPSKLVVYDKGGHGFGMRKQGNPVDNWTQELEAWLKTQKLIH